MIFIYPLLLPLIQNLKFKIQNYPFDKLRILSSSKDKSKFKNLTLFTCIFYFLSLIFNFPVSAADNFKTDYNVTYTVNNNGVTHADMKVALINTSSDYYYASSYKIELGFDNLSNITAIDSGGRISPKSEKTERGYAIELEFNKKVVGEGNKQEFTLSFDTPDIAQKSGKIWEINIPGIEDDESFNVFNVDLKVPLSFGKPEYIKPSQIKSDLRFTKEQLSKSGISLAFGSEQQYSFTLIYHLQNKNLFPIKTEIAIPMNTNYQDVYIESILPQPLQVKKDGDGNWLAEYDLNSAETLEIRAKGHVNIFLSPRPEVLTEKQLEKYLYEKPYWQVSNSNIRELAKTVNTPEEIYEYVINTLEYDFSRVTNSNNRLGASGVLERPSAAVCLEFTDLFIALARASGIPAREVDGYAFTENPRQRPLSLVTDILHAWPEYYDYDRQTWIMVDPTWADTTGGVDYFHKLDFDHFAFVKKGESSTYPIPAGGYKLTGKEDKKDVFIWATEEDFEKNSDLSIDSTLKQSFIAGFPIEGKITVVNKGPTISELDYLYIKSATLNPADQKIKIDSLLPFEKREITFYFEKQPVLTNKTDTVTMLIDGKNYVKKIKITPIYYEKWKLIGGILFVIFSITILIIARKTRRLHLLR